MLKVRIIYLEVSREALILSRKRKKAKKF